MLQGVELYTACQILGMPSDPGHVTESQVTSVTSDVSGARFRVLDHDTSLDYVAGSGAFNRVEVFGACCRAKSML